MKKLINVILIVTMALSLCSCTREKIYTEEEFLAGLEDMYDTEFVIVDTRVISETKIEYIVALKNDPDTQFLVTNSLHSSSEVGKVRNSIIPSSDMHMYFDPDPDSSERWFRDYGSFHTDDYSYDWKYEAVVHPNGDTTLVTISLREDGSTVYEFEPCGRETSHGICWEDDSYNIWVQCDEYGTVCYTMNDCVWEMDEDAVRPDDIISIYDEE